MKKILCVVALLLTSACGSEHPIPEGVYRGFISLYDTTISGDLVWPSNAPPAITYWSVAKVRSTEHGNKRWIRNAGILEGMEELKKISDRLETEELNEGELDGRFYYESGWDEAGWGIVFSVDPTRRKKNLAGQELHGNSQLGFEGDLLIWYEDLGVRTYRIDAEWICYNHTGIGCGDGFW